MSLHELLLDLGFRSPAFDGIYRWESRKLAVKVSDSSKRDGAVVSLDLFGTSAYAYFVTNRHELPEGVIRELVDAFVKHELGNTLPYLRRRKLALLRQDPESPIFTP